MVRRIWQWPPIAKPSTAAIHGFSMPGAVDVVGQHIGRGDTAKVFVHEAQFALQIPEKRDRAVIQVRQVDAGAEDAAARRISHAPPAARAAPRCRSPGRASRHRRRSPSHRSCPGPRRSGSCGLLLSRCAARPCRSTRTGPRSTKPCASNVASAAAVSGRGSSIAWHRCVPQRGCARMCASSRLWSISRPCLSFSFRPASAGSCARVGTRPG